MFPSILLFPQCQPIFHLLQQEEPIEEDEEFEESNYEEFGESAATWRLGQESHRVSWVVLVFDVPPEELRKWNTHWARRCYTGCQVTDCPAFSDNF